MLLANLFLLALDFDRLKPVLTLRRIDDERPAADKTAKFPIWFFAFVLAAVASVIVVNAVMYDIRPGNSRLECTNGCRNSRNPGACQQFCGCIYDAGKPLRACLDEFAKARGSDD
jgi:hypothetical protein